MYGDAAVASPKGEIAISQLETHEMQLPKRASASQRILDILRTKVIRAELRPGTVLLEPELAQEFNVSKTPIREALQILVAERLVTVIPRRGYYVSPVSFHEFREAMDLRAMLEPPLAAEAARNRSEESLQQLRGHLESQFAPESSLTQRIEAATAFHVACASASGNSLAVSVITALFTAVKRLHYLNKSVEGHLRSSDERAAHAALIDAISARDPALAARLMADHLAESNGALARAFTGVSSDRTPDHDREAEHQ